MKFPLSWLKEFVDPELTPEEIGHLLTMAGLEVDSIEPKPMAFEGVVVGQVLSTEQHPDADKLTVAQVSDGTESFTVVCGAANCRPGIKVAFAKIGAKLDLQSEKPFKIKKGKLRGITSEGMLCALVELGLGARDDGIDELPEDWELGTPVADKYGEIIFEVSLTPNLGHCFSVLGIARELAALTGRRALAKQFELAEEGESIDKALSVSVKDHELCPRYACRLLRGVKVGPSPQWLVDRLQASGMRSVNTVVDVTNLVMIEVGQPLHAFDYDRIADHKIVVHTASPDDKLTTLDDEPRTLRDGMVVISDTKEPIAIGGIMGGLHSEVSQATTDIVIEAAHFSPSSVRLGSKHLNLKTEASKRFERGVDPNGVRHALDRAAFLIHQIAGGQVAKGVIDTHAAPFERIEIKCRLDRANDLLGTQLAMNEAEQLFKQLECEVVSAKGGLITVRVPTYRSDLNVEVDLIEELGRLYGYDNIALRAPTFCASRIPHSPMFLLERAAHKILRSVGLQELITCNLISPKMAAALPDANLVPVRNPASVEQSILRPSLLPNLLQVVALNASQQRFDVAGYEIGVIHFADGEQICEQDVISLVMTGSTTDRQWDVEPKQSDYYDLKGAIEHLLAGLNVETATFAACSLATFHPGRQASVAIGGQEIGTIGQVHPKILRSFGIDAEVLFAELNLNQLKPLIGQPPNYQPLPLYPGSDRDWTITISESTPVAELLSSVKAIPSRLLKNVSVRGIYRSPSLGDGWKNVTLRFLYRDDSKTVAVKAVEGEHSRIVDGVIKKLAERVRT